MGKKSKRSKPKKGQKGGSAARAPAAAAASSPTPERAEETQAHQPPPPPDASCWICLDGDPDEGGKPIVRDCSCRGDDAGFAHISCLVKYAEGKTKEIEEAKVSGQQTSQHPSEPWEICPHCRREYQGRVAIEMSKSLLSYIDDNYPPSAELIKLGAFATIMQSAFRMRPERNPDVREEGKRAATQMLEVIQRSGHLEDEGYINEKLAYAHIALARFCEAEKTREGDEKALEYWGEARDLYKSRGNHKNVRGAEQNIERLKAKCDGRPEDIYSEQLLKDLRLNYQQCVKEHGEESSVTVRSGTILITNLLLSGENNLECERLCVRLLAISRRVHGPDHDLTGRIESGLKQSRVRWLGTVAAEPIAHRVLEVNEEERKYTTKSSDGVASEVAFDDDYMIVPGTPVVCQGLKSAQHLNGKLGDVRSFDTETNRYAVRFEDKTLNKASVKAVNLRIVMDLPAEP